MGQGSDSKSADVADADGATAASVESWLKQAAHLSAPERAASTRFRVGESLCGGRFRIERVIGEGGMGVVYEALDKEGERRVALKALNQVDAAGIYRLKTEFRSLAEVAHSNLVRLHELFVDESRWFFSLELVAGLPFDEWVRPQRVLDEARLRSALGQLVTGTSAIHAAGKLHCDLKPSNVLVTPAGRLVILDFGLVADPEGGVGRTLDDRAMAGTPAYMAPEQTAGEHVTPASDWYAVGVMLFEALTGRLPFEGSAGSILARKQFEDAPRPSAVAEGVPPDLDAVCAALLSRAPDARPTKEQLVAIVGTPSVEREATAVRAGGEIDLVGREGELSELREAFATTRAGTLTVVHLIGESGVGKSALVARFLEDLVLSERAVVLDGRCYEAESVPYKAFDRVIDQLTRHLRRAPAVEAATLLPRDIAALARLFPVLDRVESIAHAPRREVRDDRELRDRAFAALAELLARMRDRRPVVLCIDDMHWTDFDSTLLLERLVGDPQGAPVLYLLSHRAVADGGEAAFERLDRAVRANRSARLHRIEIGALSHEAAVALARGLLDDAPGLAARADAIAEESNGSPFFVAELVGHLRRSAASSDGEKISLRNALGARLAALDVGSREVLELVALSGRPVPVDVIERAAEGVGDVRTELAAMRAAQLVRPSNERAYECYHDRIRVAIVERIEEGHAGKLHARLADAWSRRPDPDPEVLLEHCRAAGMREATVTHALAAAERASHNLAFERAAEFYSAAIALLPEDESERLGLRERRAEALSMAGRWAAAGDEFAQAARRAAGRRRTIYLGYQAALHHLASGHVEGIPRLRWVLGEAGLRWPSTRAGAWLSLLWRLLWLGATGARYRLADGSVPTRFEGRGRTIARLFPDGDEKADGAVKLEMLLAAATVLPPYDFARGLYFMTAFARHALRLGDPARVPIALGMLSALFSASRFTAAFARTLGERAVALARASPDLPLRSGALSFAGFGRFRVGALEEALALGTEAERALQGLHRTDTYEAWTARTLRSFALTMMGRVGEAADLFAATGREARELGDELAVLGGESVVRYLVGDDVEGARDLVERKRARLTRIGEEGAVHQIVLMDRITCALYEGRGGELASVFDRALSAPLATVDAQALPAQCALQAIARGAAVHGPRRVVERAIRQLDRGGLLATIALAAQLRAALALLDGDEGRALAEIAIATDAYTRTGMKLHAAILRWHRGRIEGGIVGSRAVEEAEAFMRAQGIVNPTRWAHMLAPGLSAGTT